MSHRDPAAKTGWPRPVLGEGDFDPPDDEVRDEPPAARGPDAARCLVDAALDRADATDVAKRLTASEAIAVVVRVPGPGWVEPVEEAFERLGRRIHIFVED